MDVTKGAVAAIVALCVAGGVAGYLVADRGQVLEGPGGLLVVATGPTSGGMDALGVGTLVQGDGGCLALAPPGGGEAAVLVLPQGTRLLGGDVAGVALRGGAQIRLGEAVELGGGYVHPTADERHGIPEGCAVGAEVFVVAP